MFKALKVTVVWDETLPRIHVNIAADFPRAFQHVASCDTAVKMPVSKESCCER